MATGILWQLLGLQDELVKALAATKVPVVVVVVGGRALDIGEAVHHQPCRY